MLRMGGWEPERTGKKEKNENEKRVGVSEEVKVGALGRRFVEGEGFGSMLLHLLDLMSTLDELQLIQSSSKIYNPRRLVPQSVERETFQLVPSLFCSFLPSS